MHYHHNNNNNNDGNSTNSKKNGSNEESASANKSHHSLTSYLYLFLEEVLFLKERGLVEVYQIHDTNSAIHNYNDTMQNNVYDLKLPSPSPHSSSSLVPSTSFLHHELDVKKISTPELYSLLSVNNIPFPVYLVYAHLRTQTFIVLRHFPYRSLVVMNNNENNAMNKKEGIDREKDNHYDEQQHNTKSKEVTSTTAINNNNNVEETEQSEEAMLHNQRNQSMLLQEQKSLKTFLRTEAFHLKPPLMLSHLNTGTNNECTISFDIYKPKSDFRRSSPGKPDFYVSVLNFNSHTTTFSQLYNFVSEPLNVPSISHHDNLKNNQYYQSLIVDSKNKKDENENIEEKVPIKLGLVSDSGTVIMFGITLGEIANISTTTTDKNDESTTTSK